MNSRRLIVSGSTRNPFEVFLLLACILGGIGGLIDPNATSQAIVDALPLWERYTWYIGLCVAGTISLVGLLGTRLIYLYVERMGLTLLTGLSCGYSIALFAALSRPLTLSALTIACFTVSCFVRLLQINRDLRQGVRPIP